MSAPALPDAVPWHLLPGPLVMIDLETTGVRVQSDRIVELAAVRKAPGEPTVVLNTLVDHGRRTVGATHVHGITRRMLDGAPTIEEVLPLLEALCAGATMVAHNASFEHRFLSAEMERSGGLWALPRLCTLALSRRLHPERKGNPGHRLGGMADLYEVPVRNAHSALGDVRMMSGVLGGMLRRHADLGKLPRFLAESIRTPEERTAWPRSRGGVRLKPRLT